MTASFKHITESIQAAQRGDYSRILEARSGGELGELEREVNRIIAELQTARLGQNRQQSLQREMNVSRAIQASLLPSRIPTIEGFEMNAFYQPAQEIGGDYYDLIELDDHHLGIAIADVSGKSISGAMMMSIARNTLRSQAMLSFSPAEVLERTRAMLSPNLSSEFFISIFYAILDSEDARLTCANAGHPPLFIWRGDEKRCDWIQPQGMAVGFEKKSRRVVESSEERVSMKEGDLAFFYTDGITESMNGTGDYFGRSGIESIAKEKSAEGVEPFLATLKTRLMEFSPGGQMDDMTGVVLQRKDSRRLHAHS